MMLRLAALLVLLSTPAMAAEFRPLNQSAMCLDGGEEVRPGINRIKMAECNDSDGQNFMRGREHTIFVGKLCLQAVSVAGADKIEVAAVPCHGRDGQRWVLTRDGRLTSGDRLCLTVTGKGAEGQLSMNPCKRGTEDSSDQKWALHGKFER